MQICKILVVLLAVQVSAILCAFENDPLADEVNRRNQREHYQFEGTWIPDGAFDGIKSIVITPRSTAEGETSAVITLAGDIFRNHEWTSVAVTVVDRIDSLHIGNTWSTQHERKYEASIRYSSNGGSAVYGVRDTLRVSCPTQYVGLTSNNKTPDRMQLTLRVYGPSSASFPEIDYNETGYRARGKLPGSSRIYYRGVARCIQASPTAHTVWLKRE